MDEVIMMTVAQVIIEVFEDYLEERGIEIPNVEKEGIDGEAIIYGTDYSELESQIEEVLTKAIFRDRLTTWR